MKGFPGFPDGKLRLTSIPNLFFSDLMPVIDDLPEMKVTLYAFWALSQQEGQVRYLRQSDFLQDTQLMKGLGVSKAQAKDVLINAVERAVARGTFLHVNVESADGAIDYYFLNTEKGRAAVEGIARGQWRPGSDDTAPITLLVERPNIFVLYEQNIGPLTPLIADELRDAEETYPVRWIEEAIQIAVQNNVRKWTYVLAILERWRQEGKADGKDRRDPRKNAEKHIPEEFQDIIKR
jgi:DnaD/phage-associated family protein